MVGVFHFDIRFYHIYTRNGNMWNFFGIKDDESKKHIFYKQCFTLHRNHKMYRNLSKTQKVPEKYSSCMQDRQAGEAKCVLIEYWLSPFIHHCTLKKLSTKQSPTKYNVFCSLARKQQKCNRDHLTEGFPQQISMSLACTHADDWGC